MENKTPLDRFHENISDLADAIAEIIQECHNKGCEIVNPFLARMGADAVKSYNKVLVIETFIKRSEAYWPQINERNEEFFNKNVGEVFQGLPIGNVNSFKSLLEARDMNNNLIVTDIDRKTIWEYFHSFVKIAIYFVHEQRNPDVKIIEGKKAAIYRKKYMPNFHIEKHKEDWELKLVFRKRR